MFNRAGIFQTLKAGISLRGGNFAKLNGLIEIGADFSFRALKHLRERVFEDGAVAAHGGDVRDAAPHDACANDGDSLDFRHRLRPFFQRANQGVQIAGGAAQAFCNALALVGFHAGNESGDAP